MVALNLFLAVLYSQPQYVRTVVLDVQYFVT